MSRVLRDAILYDLNGAGTWPLTRREAAFDLTRGYQLGDTLTEWNTTDRGGHPYRVTILEGLTHDAQPHAGVYIIPA